MGATANNGYLDLSDLHVRPLLDTAMDLALAGVPVMPCHWPVEADPRADSWTGWGCSCADGDCPAPARHVIDGMTVANATTDPVLVAQWWTGGLWEANLATVAGTVFDVVQLRYSARPAEIRAWLDAARVVPGPVLDAGLGRVQFLTSLGAGEPQFAPLGSIGGVRLLGHGSLVLLPPSRLTDRHEVTWLQGPHGVPLPNPEQLFGALTRLPVDPLDLAAWARTRTDVA
jgi:hypothetical protein